MKKKTINHVLIDLRNASSQVNKHRHLSTSNVITTRTHGAFVNVLSEEELRFLEFSVSTVRESLHDLAISMEKASISCNRTTFATIQHSCAIEIENC